MNWTLLILAGLIYIIFGVLAVAVLDAGKEYRVISGGTLVISMIALIVLTVISLLGALLSTAIWLFLARFAIGKPIKLL